ncbi:hypothetical protein [Photobacterium sp. GB-36]|uniref:hypothetical protein n=1 Tax=Photobacterium sp. GB-36 TaxID=2022108 RepID=UPI000D151CB4|nr:hypothetical protein [Photobacterium sp. GB-36]PSV41334.1 hypothetical protein C9J46_18765 [Photobacterium sp. GB-36]
MTIKWPREKQYIENQTYNNDNLDLSVELHELREFSEELKVLFSCIEKKVATTEVLRVEAYKISEALNLNRQEEYQDLMIGYVCSLSLSSDPTLANWEYVKQVSHNSWYIENYLFDIIMYGIDNHYCKECSFIALAVNAFGALSSNNLPSKFDRINQARNNNIAYWNREENKLEQLWWGLRNSELAYEEEKIIFRVLFQLDKRKFIELISSCPNPFFIESLLWTVGLDIKYESWADIAISAPSTFNEDGSWCKSSILPLLLVSAYRSINNASESIPRYNPEQKLIIETKDYIAKLVKAVVLLLSKRDDSTSLLLRWSIWLMRNILIQKEGNESDLFSSSYLDSVIIDEIGRVLQESARRLWSLPPVDLVSWEEWCYKALLSRYLWKGYDISINVNIFVEPWEISIESWEEIKSNTLKSNITMFMNQKNSIPMSAYSFSYPISQQSNPDEIWRNTWINLQSVKDIVEIGYPTDDNHDMYTESTTANKILLSFLYLGIGILDYLYDESNKISNNSGRLLYQELLEACNEMREINYFIDREEINAIFTHLVVRRIIWEGLSENDSLFTECSSPTINEIFSKVSNDIVEVWRLIQIFITNKIELERISCVLKEANIDLKKLDEDMKILTALDASRYPYDSGVINNILLSNP